MAPPSSRGSSDDDDIRVLISKLAPKLKKANLMLLPSTTSEVPVLEPIQAYDPSPGNADKYLNSPLHADVLLHVKADERIMTFYAHWSYVCHTPWFAQRKEPGVTTIEVNVPSSRLFLEALRYIYCNTMEARWYTADNIMEIFANALFFDLQPVIHACIAEFPRARLSVIQQKSEWFHHSRFGIDHLRGFCASVMAASSSDFICIIEMCLVYSQGGNVDSKAIHDLIIKSTPRPPYKPIPVTTLTEYRRRFGSSFNTLPASTVLESARSVSHKLVKLESRVALLQTELEKASTSTQEVECMNCRCVLPLAVFTSKKSTCPLLTHTSGFDSSKYLCCGSLGHVKGCVIEYRKHVMA
ncbi:hypothetical protein SmJEL517_g03611 [Synchytrium microbalum]|uniref:BTB domain-containing protein n=1 Tax=Synchytrium microbalum TaxID=1806994 RepID=A0A507C277_9FUNG|nr:uncharacterized protein SmJEL517_g03611 [Synchytrium microbalum]TPX33468.1 hypothetical protein SmJEL517_g03611 [Synchytrium microbalum]